MMAAATRRGGHKMQRTVGHWAVPFLLVSVLAGCVATDAVGVETSAISPRIRVEAFPDGRAEVSVALRYGFARVLELPAGDQLTVRREGEAPVTMVAGTDALGQQAYLGTVTGVGSGDALIVGLSRAVEEDAPSTRLTVPTTFALTAPAANTVYDAGDPIPMTWTAEAGDGVVEARLRAVACVDADAATFEFVAFINGLPASFDLSAGGGSLANRGLIGDAASCTFDLWAGRGGGEIDLDPAFAGVAASSVVVRLAPAIPVAFQAAP